MKDLLGEWTLRAVWPDGTEYGGWATFEEILGGAFVLGRSDIEHPYAPEAHSLIADGAQHYFDSRGVVRKYDFALADGVWTLSRFGEPPFDQRFRATLDGDVWTGAWERTEDGEWMHDFHLTYTRVR